MLVLTERAEAEIEVKRSRFIAIALPANTPEDVRNAVLSIRKEHPDANHVVHAAVIGKAGTEYSVSDDREPKNTAGRPALEVLKGSGITNIVICIVRYFGGTLLGTGGLVKAYGDSAKEVLKIVRTEELIEKRSFRMVLPYSSYTLIKRAFEAVHASVGTEDFADMITVEGTIPLSEADALRKAAEDIGQGRILLEIST